MDTLMALAVSIGVLIALWVKFGGLLVPGLAIAVPGHRRVGLLLRRGRQGAGAAKGDRGEPVGSHLGVDRDDPDRRHRHE